MTTETKQELTPAARAAIGERLRKGRENANKATAEQMLAATMGGKVEITEEDVFGLQQKSGPDGPTPVAQRANGQQSATVTHQTAAKVWMYKPTPQGYRARSIPASNIGMVVRQGWLAACPDCGRGECRINGDQNDCPAVEPRKFQRCPIASCRKKFFDTVEIIDFAAEEHDPNEVVDDLLARTTPEARIWTELSAHLINTHPKEAPRYGAVPVVITATAQQMGQR